MKSFSKLFATEFSPPAHHTSREAVRSSRNSGSTSGHSLMPIDANGSSRYAVRSMCDCMSSRHSTCAASDRSTLRLTCCFRSAHQKRCSHDVEQGAARTGPRALRRSARSPKARPYRSAASLRSKQRNALAVALAGLERVLTSTKLVLPSVDPLWPGDGKAGTAGTKMQCHAMPKMPSSLVFLSCTLERSRQSCTG